MKKRILSGLNVLLLLLLLFLFNIPGCSLIRRPSPPRSPYARAMEKLRNGNPAAAASLLAFVNPDEEIYPAALIRGLEAAYNRDETLYVQFLSRLAEVLPRYPFLDDYYYYALMRQQAARGEHEYLLAYREFFELVGEEDLYKELLYYHVESLMKAGREDEALKEAASLYRRRLPKEHRAALEQLIISLLQKDAAPLQGPEWALLSSLPLRSSWVKRYLTTHFEDSRFWWETASRFLSIREMQAMGEGMNGYILARLFDRARATTETRHLISNHLDDPALKYPSPLAALFLTLFPDDLRNFAFFTMLDEEAAGATANHLFKSLLEMRRYDILKKWLSVWSREKGAMSAETRARFLYWEALL
ncbi:MAG TPA: hypothetical protein ENL15_02690, partial [Firmicutes bacterium]|nr:hypothetical protein [Bacillota bacterium]